VRAGPFIAPLYPMTSHTKLPEGDFPKPVYVVFLISYLSDCRKETNPRPGPLTLRAKTYAQRWPHSSKDFSPPCLTILRMSTLKRSRSSS
jgi:hypothetical protein